MVQGVKQTAVVGRKGRRPRPPGETRRATFVRLANQRVPAAISAIALVGNLANAKNYTWTRADVEQIEAALLKAVELTMALFRKPRESVPGFRLQLEGDRAGADDNLTEDE